MYVLTFLIYIFIELTVSRAACTNPVKQQQQMLITFIAFTNIICYTKSNSIYYD